MDSSHSDGAAAAVEEIFQSYDKLKPNDQYKANRRQMVKDGELSSNSL